MDPSDAMDRASLGLELAELKTAIKYAGRPVTTEELKTQSVFAGLSCPNLPEAIDLGVKQGEIDVRDDGSIGLTEAGVEHVDHVPTIGRLFVTSVGD